MLMSSICIIRLAISLQIVVIGNMFRVCIIVILRMIVLITTVPESGTILVIGVISIGGESECVGTAIDQTVMTGVIIFKL